MVMSRSYALSREEILRALTVYTGITTADGAVTKDSLVDVTLIGAKDWITGKTILIDSGLSEHQDKGATVFNTATGEITVVSPFTDRIMAGVTYRILNVSPTALVTPERATNLDNCTYIDQLVPIMMNSSQIVDTAAADKDFIADNTRGGQGLISTDNTKMQKAFLLIIGRAANIFAGDNYLDCSTATDNQWQMNLGGGAYSDLVNGAFPDGQMLDGDWRCHVDGDIQAFTLCFDITSQLTNVDGFIGLKLQNGRAIQDSMIVTCDIYLRITWKL